MAEIAINPTHNVFKKYKQVIYVNPYLLASSLDADASAFIAAATITDEGQKTALNTLVNDLKSNGLWTRLKAIYPFVGGTEFSHKWNLKDPRDLDIAFRLQFLGVPIHSLNGVKPNGGATRTFLKPNLILSPSNGNLTFYSRENLAGGYDMGASEGAATTNVTALISRYSSNIAYSSYGNGSYAGSISSTDSKGMWMTNRNDATNTTLWKNGLKLKTVAEAVTLPVHQIILFGISTFSDAEYNYLSNKECAYASIGGGFSDAEALVYYNIIQSFQTALGRQV
jgi:hypothetical protein